MGKTGFTLTDILKLINFKQVVADEKGMYQENTEIVRIYFDINDWFEFGVYDFDLDTPKRIKKILTEDVLNSTVISIRYSYEAGVLEIWLEETNLAK